MHRFLTLGATLSLPLLLAACSGSVSNQMNTDTDSSTSSMMEDDTSSLMMDDTTSGAELSDSGATMDETDSGAMMDDSTSSDNSMYDNPEDNARD